MRSIKPNKINLDSILNLCIDKIHTLFLSIYDYFLIFLDTNKEKEILKILKKIKNFSKFLTKKKDTIDLPNTYFILTNYNDNDNILINNLI